MRSRTTILTMVAIAVGIATVSRGADEAGAVGEMRTWTSTSGAKVEAIHVETRYGKVSLRKPDGSMLSIPLARLSSADRAWIKEQAQLEASGGPIAPAKSADLLATFAQGKWKGLHAVREARNYDAVMEQNGAVSIYPKDKGRRVGKPITLVLRCGYKDTKKAELRHRFVSAFTNPPTPCLQPEEITLHGTLRDDVPFSVTFAFEDDQVAAWGYCKDPETIEYSTAYRIMAGVPASHLFTDEDSLEERREILEDWQVVIEPLQGKRRVYPYAASTPSMGVAAKRVNIDTPFYGKREISFRAESPDKASLSAYIYAGHSPYQGYVVSLWKRDPANRSKTHRIEVDIK